MALIKQSKCWDCANSTNGGCDWSYDLTPVDGWIAEYNAEKESYCVIDCPEFVRDSYEYGLKRIEKEKQT